MLPRPCRALVLVNPQSGAGRALEDFQAVVQPMLAEADIAATVFITGESTNSSLTSSSLPGILPGCCHRGTGCSEGLAPSASPRLRLLRGGLNDTMGGLSQAEVTKGVRGHDSTQKG